MPLFPESCAGRPRSPTPLLAPNASAFDAEAKVYLSITARAEVRSCMTAKGRSGRRGEGQALLRNLW
jgi:hypothetical protein